jgi:hypothetical protein
MCALLARCKLEELVLKKRKVIFDPENQISLVEDTNWTSLCPLAPEEVTRMCVFWEAVALPSCIPTDQLTMIV